MAINNFVVAGYVGSKPETFEIKNGEKAGEIAASFSLAEQGFKEGDEPIWHKVNVFGNLVDTVLNSFEVGTKLVIQGRAKPNAYINKEQKLVPQIIITLRDFEYASDKVKPNEDITPPDNEFMNQ